MPDRTRRHQEYIDLYRLLSVRYDDPLYPRSEAVNVAMLKAAEDAPDDTEFRRVVWTTILAIDEAKALMLDVAAAEATLWEELGDPVRAHGAREVIRVLDSVVNILTLIEVEADSETRRAYQERLDELVGEFAADFEALEDIEVWETAAVPARWREVLDGMVEGKLAEGRSKWAAINESARAIDPMWSLDERAVWDLRHRRKIPFPDHIISTRFEQHRRYRGA
ncbi:MAG: hypothetical protein L0221_08830 [Chloroflexi bacterium]|nr:hypothetical protein [Chloroflexota bacterium]